MSCAPDSPELITLARTLFGEAGLAAALAAIARYGTEAWEPEVDRVRLAILKLSEGNADKLQYWLAMAKSDYRDPLAALELGPMSAEAGARLQAQARRLIDRWGDK